MDRLGGLVVIAPARRAGGPGSFESWSRREFSLKLLISTCQMVILEVKIPYIHIYVNSMEWNYFLIF